jgi:hypothetical protein
MKKNSFYETASGKNLDAESASKVDEGTEWQKAIFRVSDPKCLASSSAPSPFSIILFLSTTSNWDDQHCNGLQAKLAPSRV